MAYTDDYDLRHTTTNNLHKKVATAIDVAARNVLTEDPTTPQHAERLEWAKNLRTSASGLLQAAQNALSIILDEGTIADGGNNASDELVQAVVDNLVTKLATGE